MLVVQILTRLI